MLFTKWATGAFQTVSPSPLTCMYRWHFIVACWVVPLLTQWVFRCASCSFRGRCVPIICLQCWAWSTRTIHLIVTIESLWLSKTNHFCFSKCTEHGTCTRTYTVYSCWLNEGGLVIKTSLKPEELLCWGGYMLHYVTKHSTHIYKCTYFKT